MNDLDALLKEFEPSTKPTIKGNIHNQQQKFTQQTSGLSFDNSQQRQQQQQKLKLPIPSSLNYDTATSDNRKRDIPAVSNVNINPEIRRPSILKQPPKPSVDQSFDIDAILQGRSMQPKQQTKNLIAPAKNSASSSRRDSISDWFNNDRTTTKMQLQKPIPNKAGKPTIGFNADEFFSNTSNNRNREQNETTVPFSTTKSSAKKFYQDIARYKPGKSSCLLLLLLKLNVAMIIGYI